MYDYGIAAIAGLKLGLVRPYVGLGIGNQQFNYDPEDNQEITDVIPDDASSFYWNGFGGAEISILPFLSPFIEYRIANLTSADDIHFDRSEEHTSELQSRGHLVCRLLLEKKKKRKEQQSTHRTLPYKRTA